ncbi:hypothetical protein L873DRAFT_1074730 [Choiromyces venosus 120613-1]|uniref:Uncharacterized protein n=1 Tax=Choiromyces venosus 120613-1 TaxID=1336337 RepID=A0A3N4JM89_9PEZI|nr:hypothetical protein L873DRAFT_1074730 [Choiromyces venosus 120613-1]
MAFKYLFYTNVLANLFTVVNVHNHTCAIPISVPQHQPGCQNFPYASVQYIMNGWSLLCSTMACLTSLILLCVYRNIRVRQASQAIIGRYLATLP